MELTELKSRITGFYKDWFETMATFEGGTLKVKTPFYDQNFNELVFKITQASGGEVKVTLVHPMIRYFTNSDLILQLAEEGGYNIETGVPESTEGDPEPLKPANISKIVDPMTVVDSIHNFVEFFYCGQFMMRLTAFLAMMERAGILDETDDTTNTTNDESMDALSGTGTEKGTGDGV